MDEAGFIRILTGGIASLHKQAAAERSCGRAFFMLFYRDVRGLSSSVDGKELIEELFAGEQERGGVDAYAVELCGVFERQAELVRDW